MNGPKSLVSREQVSTIVTRWINENKKGKYNILYIEYGEVTFNFNDKAHNLGRYIVTLTHSDDSRKSIEVIAVLWDGRVLPSRAVYEDRLLRLVECM
ncbi:MAG: hypothetical protein AB2827_06395 [Candidatus Thiodiazotropha sp.]